MKMFDMKETMWFHLKM